MDDCSSSTQNDTSTDFFIVLYMLCIIHIDNGLLGCIVFRCTYQRVMNLHQKAESRRYGSCAQDQAVGRLHGTSPAGLTKANIHM